jgi:hypothetical protein
VIVLLTSSEKGAQRQRVVLQGADLGHLLCDAPAAGAHQERQDVSLKHQGDAFFRLDEALDLSRLQIGANHYTQATVS